MSVQLETMGCTEHRLENMIELSCQIMIIPECLQKRFTEGATIYLCISTRPFKTYRSRDAPTV
jgi:hypothetical protein